MFEVNFFEKKQKNFLPYLMALIFFALALTLGAYFLLSSARYQQLENRNNAWLEEQNENLAISREIQRYQELTGEVQATQVILQEAQYPMTRVLDELISLVPNEQQTISTFDLNEANQVSFILVDMTVQTIANTMEDIKEIPYVTSVQMLRMENQQSDNQYLVEFAISLDETALKQEVLP